MDETPARLCRYCGTSCRSAPGLVIHERSCMQNPDRLPGFGAGRRGKRSPQDREPPPDSAVGSPELREHVAELAAAVEATIAGRRAPKYASEEDRANLAATFADSPALRRLALVEPASFRCSCGRPFTESLRRPGKCMACAGEYRRTG